MHRARPLLLTLLLLVAGLSVLAPGAGAASTTVVGRMDVKDPSGVPGLVGHSLVHLNGATYVFGGRLADNTYSDAVYKHDHATGTTTRVATLPPPLPNSPAGRYSGTAVALGGKIYYMGGAILVEIDINGDGTNDPVPQSSADVFEFNPATNDIQHFGEKLPQSAWGLTSAAVSDTKAYLFGGFTFSVDPSKGIDASRRDWVVEFDLSRTGPAEKKIREMIGTKVPYDIQDAAAVRMGSMIWLFGGLTENDNATNPCPFQPGSYGGGTDRPPVCRSRTALPFDLNTGIIRTDLAKEMPYRIQFVGATLVNGKAYIPGGLLADDNPTASILEFDPNANPAVRVLTPTLPRGLYGSGAVSDGKSVFVFGGRFGAYTDLTDEIVRIDVAPTVPWAPRAASATPVQGGLRVSWEPPAYDGDSPVSLYRVYRSGPDEDERMLKETATLAVDDLTVKAGAAYVYRITALNAIGESNASARVSVNSGTTVPGAVQDFQAYGADGEVILRWRAPSETGGANLTGYRVIRDGQVVTTLPPTRTEYRDTGLANGVTHGYGVRAYNVKGDGAESPVLRVMPAAVPPSPGAVTALAAETSVSLTWEPPATAWDKFVVYRSLVPGARGDSIATITTTQFIDERVEKGRTYHYSVASVNAAGESPPSAPATVSLVRTPGAPESVRALGLEGEVRVTWQPPADSGDAPLDTLRYYVTRSNPGSAPRIVASDIKGLAWTDRTVQPGVTYTYTVTTLNPHASAASAAATATPKERVNKAPVPMVNLLPPVARVGQAVTVDASQSVDEDGVIRAYVFDFGDGTDPVQTTDATVEHTYDRNGTYSVKVIVTDDRNTDATATVSLLVGEPQGTGGTGGEFPNTGGNPNGTAPTARPTRPGSDTPDVPGPGVLLVALGLTGAALVLRRRRG